MTRFFLTMAAILLSSGAALAAPGDMNVGVFLAKADALKAKGFTAMFSNEMTLLKSEGKAAGEDYKARLQREKDAGRPSSCPPPGIKVDSNHLLAFLRTYPPAVRPNVSMKQAMADYFRKKYPCKT